MGWEGEAAAAADMAAAALVPSAAVLVPAVAVAAHTDTAAVVAAAPVRERAAAEGCEGIGAAVECGPGGPWDCLAVAQWQGGWGLADVGGAARDPAAAWAAWSSNERLERMECSGSACLVGAARSWGHSSQLGVLGIAI